MTDKVFFIKDGGTGQRFAVRATRSTTPEVKYPGLYYQFVRLKPGTKEVSRVYQQTDSKRKMMKRVREAINSERRRNKIMERGRRRFKQERKEHRRQESTARTESHSNWGMF